MKKQALLPIVGIILLAPAPSTVHGQELFVGSMIRVRASQPSGTERGWAEGSVDRLTPDTLWYQSGGGVSAMSWDNVELERSTFRDHRWAGLAIGALAGGAIGAVVGISISPGDQFRSTYPEARGCSYSGFFRSCTHYGPLVHEQYDSSTDDILGASAVGVLIGGGLGWVIGKALTRWERVELDQITVGNGNLAVSMSIRR